MRANEALLARRRREGIPIKPITLVISSNPTWEEYFALKSELDQPQIIWGNDGKWRSFDSDRNVILKRAIKTIGKWYDTRLDLGGGLVLAGNCGCGKTHLAQAVYDLFGRGAFYLNEVDMVQQIQAGYGKNGGGQSLESISGYARRAKLLIYDDLGAYETDNEKWMQNIYIALFNARKEDGKATMITTNLRLTDTTANGFVWSPFQERLGQRAYSRIMGQVEEVHFFIDLFNVPDYRLRNF